MGQNVGLIAQAHVQKGRSQTALSTPFVVDRLLVEGTPGELEIGPLFLEIF